MDLGWPNIETGQEMANGQLLFLVHGRNTFLGVRLSHSCAVGESNVTYPVPVCPNDVLYYS